MNKTATERYCDLMRQGFMRRARRLMTRAEIDDACARARLYGERRRAGIGQPPFEIWSGDHSR